MERELSQEEERKILRKHQSIIYKYHSDPQILLKPILEDYDDIKKWQLDYDEWYRNQWGHCPNFAGHF